MVRKKSNDGLLTFDEDSPLFAKKKSKRKTKPKPIDIITTDDAPLPKRRTPVIKKSVNLKAPKYVINSPADCKHILPAFKKLLNNKWKMLETDNNIKAGDVPNYIRGAAAIVKGRRPLEYEELMVLVAVAKQRIVEKSKLKNDE